MTKKERQHYRYLPAFILLVLAEGPAHGGGVFGQLKKQLSSFQADTGAIYRTLHKLEEDNAVESSWDTTVPGPAKKIYKITPIGLEKLRDWKEDIEKRIKNLNYFLNAYQNL